MYIFYQIISVYVFVLTQKTYEPFKEGKRPVPEVTNAASLCKYYCMKHSWYY